MVNIGTANGGLSHRVTEIDPRGGAAVIGPNGVGKTTTLRLFPLFYGARPSSLIERSAGQDSVIQFVLPSPSSALAFEYSRGPSEHDIRLLVIRSRGEGADSAEYRIFKSPFVRELFIDESGVVLDDEATTKQAGDLGIEFTRKLTTAEYRNVILAVPAQTQSERELRRLSVEYSLCRGAMPNLDRLVAAVVKPNVSFGDLVQVVVGMVLDKVGSPASERGKVTMRQSQTQIKRWVSDRRACEDARKLQPLVDSLKESVNNVSRFMTEMRHFASQVAALIEAREKDQVANAMAIEDLSTSRHTKLEEERRESGEIVARYSEAHEDFKTKGRAADDAEREKREYASKGAQSWKERAAGLPTHEMRRTLTKQKLDSINDQTGQVQREIGEMRRQVEDAIHEEKNRRIDLEEPARERHRVAEERLSEEERTQETEARVRHAVVVEDLSTLISDEERALGAVERDLESPQVDAKLREAVEEAQAGVNEAQEQLTSLKDAETSAKLASQRAGQRHQAAEQELRNAKRIQAQAHGDVLAAKQLLSPGGDSLLAALKSAPDDVWKSNLAKVISPELLHRTDLSPSIMAEDATGAYGWELNTGVIALPAWADDDAQRKQLDECMSREALAGDEVTAKEKALQEADSARQSAQKAENEAIASRSVSEKRLDGKKADLELARTAVKEAQRSLRETLEAKKRGVTQRKQALNDKKRSELARIDAEIKRMREEFARRRKDAGDFLAKERLGIAEGIASRVTELEAQLKGLDVLQAQKLSAAGVDPQEVVNLQRELSEVDSLIKGIESNASLVRAYEEYLEKGGNQWVESLLAASSQARKAFTDAEVAKAEFERRCRESDKAHKDALNAIETKGDDIAKEIRRLKDLAEELGECEPEKGVLTDLHTRFDMLSARVLQTRSHLSTAKREAEERYTKLRQALTSKDGNVRDLVMKALDPVTSQGIEVRSGTLESAFLEIERTIVPVVREELGTMLTAVAEFRARIDDFESEVERFNNRLTRGLEMVDSFPRLKDLELKVSTDFASLDIVRKARKLDSIRDTVRLRVADDNWLPDQGAEMALTDFMSAVEDGGRTEVSLSSRVTIKGKVTENEKVKPFRTAEELKNISSTGLSSLVLITLLVGLLNMIRKDEDVFFAWTTDEVGTFDAGNFSALLDMLRNNKIDVVTASPDLSITQYRKFAHRYQMGDGGSIRTFVSVQHGQVAAEVHA